MADRGFDRRWVFGWLAAVAPACLAGDASAIRYEDLRALNDARLYAEAFHALAPLETAIDVDPRLVRLLGEAFESGRGTAPDTLRAARAYRRAAAAGDPEAAFRLGSLLERGDGHAAVPDEAFDAYARCAPVHVECAYKYAAGVLATPGLPAARRPLDPVERLTFAAGGGSADAQLLLGTSFAAGQHVRKDETAAVRWLTRAAGERPAAHRHLGILYASRATPESMRLAVQHWRAGLAAGDRACAGYLGALAERVATREDDKQQALAYYRQASDAALPWVDEGIVRIEKHLASPRVFGVRMYGATRVQVIDALKTLGAPLVRSEPGFYDAFDSRRLAEGSSSLIVAYAPGPPNVVAEITLRYDGTAAGGPSTAARQLRQTLETQYGRPDSPTWPLQWSLGDVRIALKSAAGGAGVLTYRFAPYDGQLSEARRASMPRSGPGA
jgi:TPR repeat protein